MKITKTALYSVLIAFAHASTVLADYRTEWWEPSKAAWNAGSPAVTYDFNWFDYTWPVGADHTPGSPPDEPIDGHAWMDLAGMGMSMKIDLPSSNGNYDYSNATIQAWKAKGFRNGRFHVTPYDPNFMDPVDNRILSQTALNDLHDTCQRFVDNGMPVVVSMNSDSDFTDDTSPAARATTFTNYLEWWRQIAETLKDMSHLVSFENFIEYHGLHDPGEDELAVLLDNGEVRYPDYANWRGQQVDNWVRFPGYNNLMNEWSEVIRETNPTRILIYKPNGIGRGSMPGVTPYRYDTEGDPQGINNTNAPYWVQSVGGSANLKWEFVAASREVPGSQAEQDLLALAYRNSCRSPIDYYQGTGNPTWISLWGLQLTQDSIDTNLGGITPPDSIFLDYINWYQGLVQNVTNSLGGTVKIPSGFQQSWWLWDFSTDTWFESDQGANIGNPVPVREALSSWSWQPDEVPPTVLEFESDPFFGADAVVDQFYSATLADHTYYNGAAELTYSKLSGPVWMSVTTNGVFSGTPGAVDVGTNSWAVQVTDNLTGTNSATLKIIVFNAQPVELARYDFSGGSMASIDTDTNSSATDLIPHEKADLTIATNNAALGTANNIVIADGPMMEFTVTANAGSAFNLTSLSYDWLARASSIETHTNLVFSSLDGFSNAIARAQLNPVSEDNPLTAHMAVDLSGVDFQALTSVTFRVYHRIGSNIARDYGGILSSQSTGSFLALNAVTGTYQDVILSGVAYDTALADTDGDGMSDSDETLYGFDPNDPADADEDADGDGMTNGDEVFAGTHPVNSNSVFALTNFDADLTQSIMQWSSISGRTYYVEYSDDLTTWQPLPGAEGVVASGVETGVVDSNETVDVRFYRVGVFAQ